VLNYAPSHEAVLGWGEQSYNAMHSASALDGDEWSASLPLYPQGMRPQYTVDRKRGGWTDFLQTCF